MFEEKSLHKFSKTCFSPLKISHMCIAHCAKHLLWWGLTLKRKCSKLLKRFCTIATVEKGTWTWWKTCESNKPVLKLDIKKQTKTHMNLNLMKKKKKPVLVRPFSGLALTAWEKGPTWNGRGKNIWSSMVTRIYHDWILIF